MKTLRSLYLYTIIVALASVAPVSAAVDSEGWTGVGKRIYINRKTQTRISGDIHSLWIKIVPKKTGNLYLASRMRLLTMGHDPRGLEYIAFLAEMDCAAKLIRKLNTVYYQADKNIIASAYDEQAAWKNASPNSMLQNVFREVCAGYKTGQSESTED